MNGFAATGKRFLRDVAATVWRARWWVFAALSLCAVDQAIRMKVFQIWPTAFPRTVRLWAFYSALAVAPAFLLGRLSRFVAPVLFGYWILAEAVQLWVCSNFNMVLGGNWVLMLFSTWGTEVSEFVSGFIAIGNVLYVLVAVIVAAAAAWFFACGRRACPAPSATSVCISAACVALACWMAPRVFRAPVSWAQISRDLLALNLPVDTVANWNAYRALAKACHEDPPFNLSLADGESTSNLCIFVIGESTTRNHMGLYGYRRDTTPELETIREEGGLYVFDGLETTHPSTPEALCSLFTGSDLAAGQRISCIFPALLKKAGYSTSLISCQGSWQNRDVVGAHLFLSCDSRRFLQGERVAGTLPDEIALPEVEKALSERTGNLALFVHLYGCHNPATRRVPPDFKREWPPDSGATTEKARRKVDSYDTAVAYVDHVVASIIRMADRQDVPACVFFVSDHGESPKSPIWRDVKSRDTFEVPLMVWMSPEYRAAYPDTAARVEAAKGRRLYMDRLLEGMLELARVGGYRPWNSPDNFIAAEFDETTSSMGKEQEYAR